jgi:hypothetical protein
MMAKLGGQAGYGRGHFVENISAAKTLTSGDSGKLFTITQSSAFKISLPKAADAGVGWNAKFIITTSGSYAVTIEPDSTEDTLIGMVVSAAGSEAAEQSAESGVDVLSFINGAAAGDWVELLCDGSNFYVSGMIHDSDHVTIV